MPLTAVEQLILELVNRARLDPAAEAARLGIKLNEGLKAGSISSAPKDPLASNDALHNAADAHSQFMLDHDVFAHQDIGDGTPQSRIAAAGYSSAMTLGENIAFRGTTGAVDENAFAAAMYRDLFVDTGIAGRGHRLNILNASFREIGVGEQTGVFSQGGNNFNSTMLTQDFGARNGAILRYGCCDHRCERQRVLRCGRGDWRHWCQCHRGGNHIGHDGGGRWLCCFLWRRPCDRHVFRRRTLSANRGFSGCRYA